ncbi:hypothetical protein F0229_21870 [Vibrio sp. AIC-3]|uniref:hypothetical protein n=1 Tax=Vibrio sp. AIC-3 TaxID=2607604 RepID=UPI00149385CD|nr:hypothetical protein [Vibrio sp. AIC-3]NOH95151.1 hypothetical protein [Vibrio sp. AIC-3]
MSDEKLTFKPTLSEYHVYDDSPEVQRMLAVSAALEVIKADVSASGERKSNNIRDNMENLASYADAIQEALKLN